MALTQQEIQLAQKLKAEGKTTSEIASYLGGTRLGRVTPAEQTQRVEAEKESVVSRIMSDVSSDIKETISNVGKIASGTASRIEQAAESTKTGEQSFGRGLLQSIGLTAGGAAKSVGELFTGGLKTVSTPELEQSTAETVKDVVKPVAELPAVQNLLQKYQNLDESSKRDIDALLGVGALATELATLGVGGRVAQGSKEVIETGLDVAKTGLNNATRQANKQLTEKLANATIKGAKTKDSVLEFLAPQVDEPIKKILERTPVEKFDEAVSIARKATSDPEAITLFEKAGDKMQEAAKQLDSQRKSIIEQKEILLNKARTGLVEFKDPTRRAILEMDKLGDDPQVKSAISLLKGVKYKIDADRVIDKLQNLVYSGNETKLIPRGSTLDKRMRGIIGKYNNELKDSLPQAYRELNSKAQNRIKVIQTLNSSLGEVVDGVSTRGASLIKQFFSPSGRKAKELFDYINKNTGIDLAQDATLAKYLMEIFDDPRSKSLLEGIPRSKSGLVDSALDFTVERTGIGEKAREAVRSATIKKARKTTKQ